MIGLLDLSCIRLKPDELISLQEAQISILSQKYPIGIGGVGGLLPLILLTEPAPKAGVHLNMHPQVAVSSLPSSALVPLPCQGLRGFTVSLSFFP